MNALGRTAILTMVSLLFLVTQAYAYTISFGGVEAKQDLYGNGTLYSAGLTADKFGIDRLTNTANASLGYFIETFDLSNGAGGFNTLNATKLEVTGGGYAFRKNTLPGVAAAPANDVTNFFFSPQPPINNIPSVLPASVKVPLTAFYAYQPSLFIDYLGLYFGSVDTYNSLEFYFLDNTIKTLTGTEILGEYLNQTGNQLSPNSNVYVNIDFDLSKEVFTAFAVRTTGVALEIDNFVAHVAPVAPVPEPSTMILFGAGLLGLAALGRKRSEQ